MTTDHEGQAASAELPSIEQLKGLLDEEREKAESYMRNWQRAAADYQNFKLVPWSAIAGALGLELRANQDSPQNSPRNSP